MKKVFFIILVVFAMVACSGGGDGGDGGNAAPAPMPEPDYTPTILDHEYYQMDIMCMVNNGFDPEDFCGTGPKVFDSCADAVVNNTLVPDKVSVVLLNSHDEDTDVVSVRVNAYFRPYGNHFYELVLSENIELIWCGPVEENFDLYLVFLPYDLPPGELKIEYQLEDSYGNLSPYYVTYVKTIGNPATELQKKHTEGFNLDIDGFIVAY